ncbi:hypothetical protein BJF84_15735 [Rhodococcus sp. CUA-806]|nr:hypothetical protein BJF84_15735 [Rhodococcus sp. CUA-806]
MIKTAISEFAEDAQTPIRYTNALCYNDTLRWTSVAGVAETPFTAFASQRKPITFPAGSSCATSRTYAPRKSKARASCSTCGGSTRLHHH